MAVQQNKKSKSKTGMRKSANMAYAKVPKTLTEDKTTGEIKLPHHISPDGFYKGRDVFAKPESDSGAE